MINLTASVYFVACVTLMSVKSKDSCRYCPCALKGSFIIVWFKKKGLVSQALWLGTENKFYVAKHVRTFFLTSKNRGLGKFCTVAVVRALKIQDYGFLEFGQVSAHSKVLLIWLAECACTQRHIWKTLVDGENKYLSTHTQKWK